MHVVDAEPVAEQGPGLAELAREGRERVVLDLVDVGVDVPVGHVAVAPLGSDDTSAGPPASHAPRNSSARPYDRAASK